MLFVRDHGMNPFIDGSYPGIYGFEASYASCTRQISQCTRFNSCFQDKLSFNVSFAQKINEDRLANTTCWVKHRVKPYAK